MVDHIYDDRTALKILDAFPQTKLEELMRVARRAMLYSGNSDLMRHTPVVLPDGWYYLVSENCIIARYGDDVPQEKQIFAPEISIEFKYLDEKNELLVTKRIMTRHARGICQCGKPIRVVQAYDLADRLCEHENWLMRIPGILLVGIITAWLFLSSKQNYSLQFNRHQSCL